jgi:hypothetical protein
MAAIHHFLRLQDCQNAVGPFIFKFILILPVPCPKGTAFVNNSCVQCPLGSFQDLEGQIRCKPCPENTHTLQPGAQSNESCLGMFECPHNFISFMLNINPPSAVCGNGMFSSSGMIPCQLCPRHTFSGPPPIGGFKQCDPCPEVPHSSPPSNIFI